MTILDNSILKALSFNELLSKEFPMFLQLRRAISSVPKKTNCCGKGIAANSNPDFNSIKRTLATLSQTDKEKFKSITKFAQVKIVYSLGSRIETVII